MPADTSDNTASTRERGQGIASSMSRHQKEGAGNDGSSKASQRAAGQLRPQGQAGVAVALRDRPEWLSPRDIAEVFGVGKSKSYEICAALPHIYVGRNIRVNRQTVAKEILEKGRLP